MIMVTTWTDVASQAMSLVAICILFWLANRPSS